jgi:hypothetical protein
LGWFERRLLPLYL